MPRWYALDLAEQPVGPPFEAPTRTDAYDMGCAKYGERCVQVQSVLSWEETERERKAAEARRRKRAE